jgi:hypothetical protein
LPDSGIRQFVLSLPFALRPIVAYDGDLFAAVTRIFMSEVFRLLRAKGRSAGVRHPLCGGIAILQRSGNALDLNPHVHSIAVDGVFRDRAKREHEPPLPDDNGEEPICSEQAPSGREPDLEWVATSAPTKAELVAVSRRVCDRVLALLQKRGIADADGLCPHDVPEPMMPIQEAAARVSSRFALVDQDGNIYFVTERPTRARPPAGAYRGFSVDSGVAAARGDDVRRARIVKYCLRPPLAEEQVRRTGDGRVAVELRRRRPSGATHVVMEPQGLLKKLAALIHPPGLHVIRYFGVLSSASSHRKFVVPRPPLDIALSLATSASAGEGSKRRHSISWDQMLARAYGVDSLCCPSCKTGRMKLVAVICRAEVIQKIVAHLAHRDGRGAPKTATAPP